MRTYCSEQQFEQEFVAVVDMYREYFRLLESETFSMRLSTHHRRGLGKKYVDNERLWLHTEEMVRRAITSAGVPFDEVSDEAAFYGRRSTGRSRALSDGSSRLRPIRSISPCPSGSV